MNRVFARTKSCTFLQYRTLPDELDKDMDTNLRKRRVDNEWYLLQELQKKNSSIVQSLNRSSTLDGDTFGLALLRTSGIFDRNGSKIAHMYHEAEVRFSRFFPSVPIEVRLAAPVFHPNVDPVSGFVCLWNQFAPGDTIVETVRRLQQVISWKLLNIDPDQVIQPDAVLWFQDPNRAEHLPLEFEELLETDEYIKARSLVSRRPSPRKRLEPLQTW